MGRLNPYRPSQASERSPEASPPGQLGTLAALSEAVRTLGFNNSLEELLDDILHQAQRLIGFEHCALMLVKPGTDELAVERALGYGQHQNDILRRRMKLGEGLAGWSAQRRQAVRVGDVRRDPRYVVGLEQTRSNMVVPLVTGNETAGVIIAESPRFDAFTEVHERMLFILGTQAALAVTALRARQRLHERIDHLNILYKISQLASVSVREDFEEVLSTVLHVTQDVIPEGHCAILLLDPISGCLLVQASEGYQEGVERLYIPLGKGVTGRAAKLGRAQVVDDLTREKDYLPGVAGARSEIALPLVAEGQVIGVLNVESRQPSAYDQEQVRTLMVIAQQLAVVLRTAQLHDEARRLAITDPLTGLYNRRYFIKELEDSIRRAQRYDHLLALVFVDLDRFKTINDNYGHQTGDRALQSVAEAMRESMRETDVVARIGGEEFAALLMEADRDRALQVAERFQRRVRHLGFRAEGGEVVPINLSAGIALFPEHAGDAAALLHQADGALYMAKRRGRSQLVVGAEHPRGEP
ncbi:MAG: diguanylate cyclase [Acidobacteriota bacterium]